VDTTFAETTRFDNAVSFDVGHSDVRSGDRIVIKDVHGTVPEFAKYGIYIVRGEYTLATVDEADITFTVTATRSGEGCTLGNPRSKQHAPSRLVRRREQHVGGRRVFRQGRFPVSMTALRRCAQSRCR